MHFVAVVFCDDGRAVLYDDIRVTRQVLQKGEVSQRIKNMKTKSNALLEVVVSMQETKNESIELGDEEPGLTNLHLRIIDCKQASS